MTRWPIYVEMFEDESISSWLIRCALENGCDPLVLTSVLWPKWRVWTTDIDRGIPYERQEVISSLSGIKLQAIQQAALNHEVGLLSSVDLPKHGVWPWVQGLGARNRRYRYSLQFCPCCFSEDTKPYFRRHWRFSWNTGCLLHNVRLLDRCIQCLKPIEPQRLEAMQSIRLSDCASCGFDLRGSPSSKVLLDAQAFQKKAFSNMRTATAEIAGEVIGVEEWFRVCRHLVGLIRRSVNRPESTLSIALNESGCNIQNITPESLTLQFELLPVSVRENLLSCLEQLLCNLKPFAKNLKERGVLVSGVLGSGKDIPDALSFLTEQLKQMETLRGLKRQKNLRKPKSKTSVLKAWARLKRKYGIE